MEGNINLGADIYLPADQLLTVESSINIEGEFEDREVNYTDYEVTENKVYQAPQTDWNILEKTVRDVVDDQRENDFDVRALYEKTFNGNNDHSLAADLDFEFGKESEEVDLQQVVNNNTTGVQERSFGDEIYREVRMDVDYERPLGDGGRFEAGTRITYDWEDSDYQVEIFENGNWTEPEDQQNITDNFQYTENVNSAYAIYSGELKPFTYQIGIRAENTRIETKLDQSGAGSNQNYLNLFPSLFLSYTLNELNSFQASYSRRISRPRSWYLLPFTEIADNRNQRTGNPNLEPEFSDSYEFGYLRYWESGSLLTSVYYRHRTQVIERVSILSDDGLINTSTPINLATEDAWGIELSADQELFNDLQLSGSMNLYRSESEGEYQNVIYANETENFTSRLRVRWRFADSWNFQTYLYYRGAQETTQGRRPSRSFVGSALSKELLDGRANISVNVRDLFNSRNWDREIIEPNRYTNSEFSWSSRQIRLNFRYNFGTNN
jgi:outer membrane receptor protein involved in Fe transport